MKFACYTDWEQLPGSANSLFAQAEQESFFFSRPWFESLSAMTLDDDQSLLLACVVDGSKLLALLPLVQSPGKTWFALNHRYSSLYRLLLSDHDQEQVLACLAQGLGELPVSAFLLEPVAGDDQELSGLQRAMEVAGFSCEHMFRFYNWVYHVRGQSFAEYMAGRPARLRNTIARKSRKLEREQGYEIRLFTGAEVPAAMSDYYAVYSASWKANEQYVSFLDGIVAGFSRPGWSRLAVLYVKGQPVAAQLWFVLHGKANIFRLAYDKIWKPYSPGSILTSFLMEYVIDTDKVEEIDFLTGNDAYKQDWMSERRERFALSCVKDVKPAGGYERLIASITKILKRP